MTAALTDDQLLTVLLDASAGLATVEPGEMATPVPTCPGWDLAELLAHTGQVHQWATALLQAAPGERVRFRDLPDPPDPDQRSAWFARVARAAADASRTTPLDQVTHTWAGARPARWWRRRLAHETVVHRVDADLARGHPVAVAADVAIDGIDELLVEFGARVGDSAPPDEATAHLHATDADGEWLVTWTSAGLRVEREHRKGDVAVRGRAEDLLLVLWGRRSRDAVEVFGDARLVDRLRTLTT
jgi:uncharacterized protein (TIGR03083 family)